MARSSVCSSMNKQQSTTTTTTAGTTKQTYHDHFKLKCPSWDIAGNQYSNNNRRTEEEEEGHHHLMGAAGFPWPPRCYTCSFCKREFRSAQALGGHMNVHRRDRARLRQYSPPLTDDTNTNNSALNLNLDPYNPSLNYPRNPNSRPRDPSPPLPPPSPPPLSSLLTKFPQFSTTLPPLSAETNMVRRPIMTKDFIKMNKGLKGVFGVEKVSSYVHEKVCEKAEEFMGLDLEIGLISQAEEEVLDLELRLGYT